MTNRPPPTLVPQSGLSPLFAYTLFSLHGVTSLPHLHCSQPVPTSYHSSAHSLTPVCPLSLLHSSPARRHRYPIQTPPHRHQLSPCRYSSFLHNLIHPLSLLHSSHPFGSPIYPYSSSARDPSYPRTPYCALSPTLYSLPSTHHPAPSLPPGLSRYCLSSPHLVHPRYSHPNTALHLLLHTTPLALYPHALKQPPPIQHIPRPHLPNTRSRPRDLAAPIRQHPRNLTRLTSTQPSAHDLPRFSHPQTANIPAT